MRKALFVWVRTTVMPEDAGRSRLAANEPVCYVLENDALSGRLVLDQVCIEAHLPRPEDPMRGVPDERKSLVALRVLRGWFVRRRAEPRQSPRLARLLQQVRASEDLDVKIVPVSIFWGRSPDKEKSLLKAVFSESWAPAGRLRKLLIILVHGRQTLVQFSQPLSLRELLDEEGEDEGDRTLRKLSRVLRVHMQRRRAATIGPDLSHRRTLASQILSSRSVRTAITREARLKKISERKATRRARRIAFEIAADVSYPFIRFMDHVLTALWNKLYEGVEVRHLEKLKEVAEGNEIVYVPCHRSHIDYLLLSYVVYHAGFVTPHIAAGINLNVPVLGRFLRMGGGFFLRRKFRGDQLYSAVFQRYLSLNLSKGVSIEYFIEGTRSRTGRLLAPRSGMLAMTARSFIDDPVRPIVFVPVYFGYEKLLEGRSYISELSGRPKRKETLIGFLRSLQVLRNEFGKVYVNFGEPIFLQDLLDRHRPGWRDERRGDERPAWLVPVVDELGNSIIRHINMAAAVTPVSLVALVLLSTPRQAMLESVLVSQIELLKRLSREAPYSELVTLPAMSAAEMVAHTAKMGLLERKPHPQGDILRMSDENAVITTYNRNNVQHLFSLPSMIACCFHNNREMEADKIVQLARMVYPYLQAELFLHWEPDAFEEAVRQMLRVMVDQCLLMPGASEKSVRRPPAGTLQSLQLSVLAQSVLKTLERYYIVLALLLRRGSGTISQSDLEQLCQSMAQRMSVLYELDAPEFFVRSLFRSFIDGLRDAGVVWADDQGLLAFDGRIRSVDEDARLVLGEQIRHSILQVTHV